MCRIVSDRLPISFNSFNSFNSFRPLTKDSHFYLSRIWSYSFQAKHFSHSNALLLLFDLSLKTYSSSISNLILFVSSEAFLSSNALLFISSEAFTLLTQVLSLLSIQNLTFFDLSEAFLSSIELSFLTKDSRFYLSRIWSYSFQAKLLFC